MTRAPWVMQKPGTPWAKPGEVHDTSLGWRFTNPRFTAADRAVPPGAGPETVKHTLSMGETAEEVAALDGITRAECDAFVLRSHRRAVAAQEAGRFDREIVPVPVKDGEVTRDEGPRPSTTLEKLGSLRTPPACGAPSTGSSPSPRTTVR
jgi:acetyl-CoA acetyltransferase